MKHNAKALTVMMIAVLTLAAHPVFGQPEDGQDKTLSPYFLVQSDDPETDRMPLKSTSVQVHVSGVIADVTVTQVYENQGSSPLEAVYVFPASTKAAVHGMKMTIGERTITANIRKREDARREYEHAKQAGQSASLLEQHRPNVFQMNVANILPEDVINVELRYTELLVPTDAVYEFVYPTVVGPRYAGQTTAQANSSEQWTVNPYLHEGHRPTYAFHLEANIAAGLPIQDIVCSSHKVQVDYHGSDFATVTLDPTEQGGENRDFLLKYRLAGRKIQSGLVLYEGKDENFFLLMVQPPNRVAEHQIPPREYVFIVDVSGSMHGFPLDVSKKLLKDLISKLRPTDRFNVLLFAGGSSVMSESSLPATQANISRGIRTIEEQRGAGSTELLPALKRGLALPPTQGLSRSVVIVTDGYVSVEAEAFDLIRRNLAKANLFAFGIGSSVNRHIIEGMARVGMGEPFVITGPEEAPEKADKFRKLIQSPVLTDIKMDFDGFHVFDTEPLNVPDVLAGRPVIVFGKWRGKPKGQILLRGATGDGPFMTEIDVAAAEPMEANGALRYLWARHRIAILSDYNRLMPDDERVAQLTDLGLTYNLLTAYTSFVAVDTEIRLENGQAVTVKQPLPLPQGVSDYAVGGGAFLRKAARSVPAPLAMHSENVLLERRPETKEEILDIEPSSTQKPLCIEVGEMSVPKGLSKSAVERLLKRHIHSFNLCCPQGPQDQSISNRRVVLSVTVDSRGNVIGVEVDASETGNASLEQCLMKKLEKIPFPSPIGGARAVLKITFVIA